MFTLAEYGSAIAMETAFWFPATEDETYPLEQLGSLTLTLERSLRALANIAVLSQFDIPRFKQNLVQAAEIRLAYLARVREEKRSDDHHFATGRFQFIVDAIAAGAWSTAQRIHERSPKQFNQIKEYRDDYCFAALLGEFLQPQKNQARIDSLLADFEQYLSGDNDPRFGALSALNEGDQKAFFENIEALLQAHEDNNLAAKEKGVHLDATEVALQNISTEAVALLRLAKAYRIPIADTFRYCPLALL